MLPSTSIASLPDVTDIPKHIDNPFLWIASNFFMFSVGVICQTVQPFSMIDLPRLLYILSSFVLEMFAKPKRKGLSICLGLSVTSGREAMEVEGNILPVDLRIEEIAVREIAKIQSKNIAEPVKQQLEEYFSRDDIYE
jgi:hypothetical protein